MTLGKDLGYKLLGKQWLSEWEYVRLCDKIVLYRILKILLDNTQKIVLYYNDLVL